MKKNILSIIALLVALAALAVSAATFLTMLDTFDRYEAQLDWMSERYHYLESRLDSPAVPPETEPPAAGGDYEAYCNLIMGDWTFEGGTLAISTAFAQARVPADSSPDSTRLILTQNGEERYTLEISMLPGEASDSYELDMTDLSFHLPVLGDGDQLELRLEIGLSDGGSLTAIGGSWDCADGALYMIAG